MNLKASAVAVSALGAFASGSSFAGAGGLGTSWPSASFASTVPGAFTDTWAFEVAERSIVAAPLTNVGIAWAGRGLGGITGLTAHRDGSENQLLTLPQVTRIAGSFITTQVLAGGTTPAPAVRPLVISATGIYDRVAASYGGNMVATPVPEPGTYMMMFAGVVAMGAVVRRRRVA